jgi:hypothetical protein
MSTWQLRYLKLMQLLNICSAYNNSSTRQRKLQLQLGGRALGMCRSAGAAQTAQLSATQSARQSLEQCQVPHQLLLMQQQRQRLCRLLALTVTATHLSC